jgi:glycosyl transferase, family 25
MNLDTISFLNQYFDKIYVVSLRRATDRQANIKKLLDGLNYEFWWAVDKNDFTIDDVIASGTYDEAKALKDNRYGIRKLLAGEVACSWSHRNIYQTMLDNNYHRVLIFEDDVVPNLQTLELLPTTLQQLPNNWELCYLGYLQNETFTMKQRFKKKFYQLMAAMRLFQWIKPSQVKRLFSMPYSDNLRQAGLHDCTHAYALTQSAARKLVKAHTPIYSCADEILTHEIIKGNLCAFVCTPTFFDQEDFIRGHQNSDSYIWS